MKAESAGTDNHQNWPPATSERTSHTQPQDSSKSQTTQFNPCGNRIPLLPETESEQCYDNEQTSAAHEDREWDKMSCGRTSGHSWGCTGHINSLRSDDIKML